MHILHIAGGGDVGGAKTHVISLLQELQKEHDVTLVSLRRGAFSEDAENAGIPTVVIDSSNYLRIVPAVQRLIKEREIDVVHCHGGKANLAGLLLRHRITAPVVTTVHSDYRYDYIGSLRKRLTNGLINTVSIRRLNYHVAVSDAFADLLIDRGFDPDGVFTIHNSVGFSENDPIFHRADTSARKDYLSRVGLSCEEDTVIVSIAVRFHPIKNVGLLLKAFKDASNEDPRLRLLIGGAGIDEQEIQEEGRLHALFNEYGLSGKAAFVGWVDDMDTFLSVTDISVLCSLSEGFPYSVLESVRAGATLCCSRVGALPSIIDHGYNGLLFDSGDAAGLCRSILALSKDTELRQKFAKAQYMKCRKNYSISTMAKRQIEIYETVLRRHARPRRWRDGVTVCGAYGFHNAGDEAILTAILRDMRSIDPDIPITVISKSPKLTRRSVHAKALYTFSIPRILFALSRSTLYINGGGTLMQDITSTKSLMYYLFTLKMAKMVRTPVMLYGSGIGPISRPMNRKIARKVLDRCTDVITLRDKASMKELDSIGVRRPFIALTGDPAISVSPPDPQKAASRLMGFGMGVPSDYACVCLRNWPGFLSEAKVALAKFLDMLQSSSGMKIVFLPMSPLDVECMRKVASLMQTPFTVIDRELPADEVPGILAGARLVISMRLHALIFALSANVPAVGMNYDVKVPSFLEYAQKPYFTELKNISPETLAGLSAQAIADKNASGIDRIRNEERKNIRYAEMLLGGVRDPETLANI